MVLLELYSKACLERRCAIAEDGFWYQCLPGVQSTALQAGTPCTLGPTNPSMDKEKMTVLQ